MYVTGFAKTVPNRTRIEIPFIAWHESQTLAPHRYTTHRAIDGQVCFYRWSFANPVKPRRSTTGSMEPLRGTNKATWCAKLLPTTVYVYQVDCGSFCTLLSTQCCCLPHCGWYCPPSASHPPPACPPLINFIRDITAVDRNHLKNQQSQLDGKFYL